MIVKIKKDEKGGWSYFECPVIHVTRKKDLVMDIIGIGESIVIWKDGKTLEAVSTVDYIRISLETADGHLRTIITDSLFYIINDNGKTIDRL